MIINVAGTTLLMVLLEVIPKLYANSHNLQVSRFMSPTFSSTEDIEITLESFGFWWKVR